MAMSLTPLARRGRPDKSSLAVGCKGSLAGEGAAWGGHNTSSLAVGCKSGLAVGCKGSLAIGFPWGGGQGPIGGPPAMERYIARIQRNRIFKLRQLSKLSFTTVAPLAAL